MVFLFVQRNRTIHVRWGGSMFLREMVEADQNDTEGESESRRHSWQDESAKNAQRYYSDAINTC